MTEYEQIVAFTIHFATINTNSLELIAQPMTLFTIHFATINTARKNYLTTLRLHLQYTLLLLIQ